MPNIPHFPLTVPETSPADADMAANRQLASLPSRLAARLVDVLLFWGPQVSAALAGSYTQAGAVPLGLLLLLGWATLPIQALLIGTRGQSVGKLVIGIAVVDRRGNRPTWTRQIAREGARYAGWTVPFAGFAADVLDAMPIFSPNRRMLHDRLSDTFVVRTRDGSVDGLRLSDVRDLPTPRPSRMRVIGTGVAAAAALVLGVYAGLAPTFYARDRVARRDEVAQTVDGIRAAERAYYKTHGGYLAVSSEAEAMRTPPGNAPRPFPGGPGWDALGWAPKGPLRGAYWVEVTEDDFRVVGEADGDEDGVFAIFDGTRMHSAKRVTALEVY